MACSKQLRRSLLLSINRAPTLSQQCSRIVPMIQTRSVHKKNKPQKDGFSISFGTQVDKLLEYDGKTSKAISGAKDMSRKMIKEAKSRKLTTANIPDTPATQESTMKSTGSNKEDEFRSINSSTESNPQPPMYEVPIVDNESTLEISDDAYKSISRPGRRHEIMPQKNPQGDGQATTLALKQRKGQLHSRPVTSPQKDQQQILRAQSVSQWPRKKLEPWQIQKEALKKKFGEEGWAPRKKLSPDAMDGIRDLHEQNPERYTTEMLSQQFKMSPEAIRRILKSKWRPSPEAMEDRRQRWARRHDRIWDQQVALGLRQPRQKEKKVDGPEAFEEELRAKRMLGQL